MSKTYRKGESNNGYGKKMKAYTPKNRRGKEQPEYSNVANPHGDGTPGYKLGISKTAKLIAKNAERAKKKAVRRIAKENIEFDLNLEA